MKYPVRICVGHCEALTYIPRLLDALRDRFTNFKFAAADNGTIYIVESAVYVSEDARSEVRLFCEGARTVCEHIAYRGV